VPEIQELAVGLESWGILAAASFVLVAAVWFTFLRGKALWPPRRTRLVAWTGFEIFLILFLNEIIIPSLILGLLKLTAWGRGDLAADGGDGRSSARLGLWVMVISCPLQVLTLLAVLRALSGTRPYQVGLTRGRTGRNLVIGWLGWLGLTPAVLIINYGVIYAFTVLLQEPTHTHPIARLIEKHPGALEWFLILFSALVTAPVLEEVFYRGVLQPWFAARAWGGWAAMLAALLIALLPWANRVLDAGEKPQHLEERKDVAVANVGEVGDARDKTQPVLALEDLEPPLFVLLMVPCFLVAPRLARSWIPARADAQALFGTALLFAMRHANVWPSPIPLFVLALGLGYVAYRTRSLAPSMLWHSLFNAVNFVPQLLM
jgi:membrane protease YdiL (CAAX protease family)